MPNELSYHTSDLTFSIRYKIHNLSRMRVPHRPSRTSTLSSTKHTVIHTRRRPDLILRVTRIRFPLVNKFPRLSDRSEGTLRHKHTFHTYLRTSKQYKHFGPIRVILGTFSMSHPTFFHTAIEIRRIIQVRRINTSRVRIRFKFYNRPRMVSRRTTKSSTQHLSSTIVNRARFLRMERFTIT